MGLKLELHYMEDEDGVHVMHPVDEGTICGTYDSEHNDLRDTRKKVVTCRNCLRLLETLGKVKRGKPAPDPSVEYLKNL